MRRLLAALMLVLVAVLGAGDPLLCPDGCNDEPQEQTGAPASSHADCLACRNAISTALPVFDLTPDGVIAPSDQALPLPIADTTPPAIDHPPRRA